MRRFRAIASSQVRGLARSGSKRPHERSARSNVSCVRSSASSREREPVAEEPVDAPNLVVIHLREGGGRLPVHRAKPTGRARRSARPSGSGPPRRTDTGMPPVGENAEPGRGTAALRSGRSLGCASGWRWIASASFLAGWLLPFALVLYLGLKGGGYDQVVYGQVGIIVWWIVVLGAAVAVLPALAHLRRRVGRLRAARGVRCLDRARDRLVEQRRGKRRGDRSRRHLPRHLRPRTGDTGTGSAAPHGERRRRCDRGGLRSSRLLSRLHPAWFPGATETAIHCGVQVAAELSAQLLERARDP